MAAFGLLTWFVPFAFVTGGFFSGLSGFVGMKIATAANSRTANACRAGLNRGLRVAFSAGSVMGFTVVGLGLLDISIWFMLLKFVFKLEAAAITSAMLTFGMGASTTTNFAVQYGLEGTFAPIADYKMLSIAVEEATRIGARFAVGNLLSSDIFYNADPEASKKWQKLGVLGVEMEAAALYMNAAYLGKRALAICTVSDHLMTGEALDADARQNSFTEMMEIALNTAIKL
jgi:purine-nucleoside phosphorylase